MLTWQGPEMQSRPDVTNHADLNAETNIGFPGRAELVKAALLLKQ